MGGGLGQLGHRTCSSTCCRCWPIRIGYAGGFSLAQLKISQEVITLAVFVLFAMFYMGQPFRWDSSVGRLVPDGGGLFHLPAAK